MTDIVELVEQLSPAEQAVAAKVLDACSRPLTAREIEGALRRHGVPKSRAVLFGASLKHLAIVAMVGPEREAGPTNVPDQITSGPTAQASSLNRNITSIGA